ncbi:MAG TPA: hypothetical protein VIN10_15070 [Bacteroidales bacterium]
MKKKYLTKILISLLFTLVFAFSYAQGGPGDPGGDPSGGGDPLGGGAPLSGGTIILLSIGAAFGGTKLINYIKKESELKN